MARAGSRQRETIAAAAHAAGDATMLINNASTAAFAGPLDADPGRRARRDDRQLRRHVRRDPRVRARCSSATAAARSSTCSRCCRWRARRRWPATRPPRPRRHSLTQALRPVLEAKGISVHGVYPAGIDTDMLAGIDAPKTPPAEVAGGAARRPRGQPRTSSPTPTRGDGGDLVVGPEGVRARVQRRLKAMGHEGVRPRDPCQRHGVSPAPG